ncbi:type I secretion system permease/ATPase [Vibrio sp. vnigr-6D03]|uniref:type I secretion system permease/ATPase n=1 Tax=Vibrio sp. vnigr-6D03 TaxID=2058088 RepID=UPI000C3406B7|nr:type I secretion system permease/ATPase [Vibrio sp. vnigr-6D03]PKF78783.1 type I secretion system permease/ATPase [Vibrio sp. vnigr-6D03]
MDSLISLVYAAKILEKKANVDFVKHKLGEQISHLDDLALCRCAKWLGLKSKLQDVRLEQLVDLPKPALLEIKGIYYTLVDSDNKFVQLYMPRTKEVISVSLTEIAHSWSGKVILLQDTGSSSEQPEHGFRWFMPSLVKHLSQARTIILISVIVQVIAIVTPFVFAKIIDSVLVNRSLSSLHVLGIALLFLALFEPIFGYIKNVLYSHLSNKFSSEISSRFYGHLISLPISFFDTRPSGEVTARIRELDQVRQFVSGSALTLILDITFVSVFLLFLFLLTPVLTALLLLTLVFYFIFWLIVGGNLRSKVSDEYKESANNTAFLTESISGIETIKTSAIEDAFFKSWKKNLASQLKASMKARIVSVISEQGVTLIQKVSSALILWWGVNLVLSGQITTGELVAFNMLSSQVTQPVLRLAQIWQEFQHSLIAVNRVGEILNEPEEKYSEGLASSDALQGSVEFRDVKFHYPGESQEVLKGINLHISSGAFIGITGGSGSGKSTLTKLLQGLYSPVSGQVFIDDADIQLTDSVGIRRYMSVVLQDSCLFSGSILDNIKICSPEATDEEVLNASKLSGAHDFIIDLSEGYDTNVGESGGLLSGGQRQRVALARALITDPKVLILDEATSALDYDSEAAIISKLPEITKGRTVISIAHRLNTICHCDTIIVMDKGSIIETGSHENLLKQNGKYAQLHDLQHA